MVKAGENPTEYVIHLKPRALEVIRLVAAGLPAKEVARRLRLSEAVIKDHKRIIVDSFNAKNMTHAVYLWAKQGGV